MVVIDSRYKLLIVNQGFKNVFSPYKKNIRRGQHLDVVLENNPELYIRIIEKLESDEVKEKFVYVLEDQFYLVSVTQIQSGDDLKFVIMLNNITKQEEIEQIRRKFISNVAHELRTPLAVVSSHAEIIAYKDSLTSEEIVENAKVIYNEMQRLGKMVSELFDITKYDQAQIKLVREEFDIYNLIKEIKVIYSAKTNKDIKITFNSIHSEIVADYDKLKQVIINLLDNAYVHTEDSIELDVSSKGNKIRLSVTDNGKGLTIEQKQQVFDRFYRTDESRNRDLGGTGLGLSIVKEIVDLHNGKIFIQGEVDKGAQFIVEIPDRS